MTTIRALLLDLGGVVLGVDGRACFRHWARAAGVPAADIARRWQVGEAYAALETNAIDFDTYLERLAAQLGIELSKSDWQDGWNALLREPIAPVVDALPRIAEAIPLYCFSNTNAVHQAVWEERLGEALRPFRKVYTSWQIGRRKPDVEAFRYVAADMGRSAGEIGFLDDNQANVAGARAAGMAARRVTTAEETLAAVDAFLTGLTGLTA
jgi:putative hydrolase of the HAD superfamily